MIYERYGDVSEQVVRLSLEGFEVLARLTGSGAKNVAAMIYTIMKDKKQTKGKINLNNMIRTGKPLKIFTVSKEFKNICKRGKELWHFILCFNTWKKQRY